MCVLFGTGSVVVDRFDFDPSFARLRAALGDELRVVALSSSSSVLTRCGGEGDKRDKCSDRYCRDFNHLSVEAADPSSLSVIARTMRYGDW